MAADFRIDGLSGQHLDQVVDVHLSSFPTFFLTSLGRRFLRLFYAAFLDDDGALGFVAVRGDLLGGVVVGSIQPEGFYRRLLQRRWWSFALASVPSVLSRPGILPRLLRALRYRGDAPSGKRRALLSSIAVAQSWQGQGVGRALVQRWIQEVQRRGADGCYLTTDAEENLVVNKFYRALGWRLEATYTTPEGRRMNRYVLDFSDERP